MPDNGHYYKVYSDGSIETMHDLSMAQARKAGCYASVTTKIGVLKNDFIDGWRLNRLVLEAEKTPRLPNETDEDYVNRVDAILWGQPTRMDGVQFQSSDFGLAVHRELELWNLNHSYKIDPAWEPYTRGWIEWFTQNVNRTIAAEYMAVDHELRTVGTVDFIGEKKDGTIGLCDFKGLHIETPILTTDGFKPMSEVRVGDKVFGADGKQCNVVEKSPTYSRPCYRLTFCDGSHIICDNVHLWNVEIKEKWKKKIVTIDADTLFDIFESDRHSWAIKIHNAKPIELPELDLPMDPYVLGFWLGDGHCNSGDFVIGEAKYASMDYIAGITGRKTIYNSKVNADESKKGLHVGFPGLTKMLRKANVMNNKHVPSKFFMASIEQRLALLQGLMDSDGTFNVPRKQCVFINTDKQLRDAVVRLVHSLGWRCTTYEYDAKGFGVTTRAYTCYFTPFGGLSPFRFNSRNVPLFNESTNTLRNCKFRRIKNMERVDSVPTQCIGVDSDDHLYLAGYNLIPTHNCRSCGVKNVGKFYFKDCMQLAIEADIIRREKALDYMPECWSMCICANTGTLYPKKWTDLMVTRGIRHFRALSNAYDVVNGFGVEE